MFKIHLLEAVEKHLSGQDKELYNNHFHAYVRQFVNNQQMKNIQWIPERFYSFPAMSIEGQRVMDRYFDVFDGKYNPIDPVTNESDEDLVQLCSKMNQILSAYN